MPAPVKVAINSIAAHRGAAEIGRFAANLAWSLVAYGDGADVLILAREGSEFERSTLAGHERFLRCLPMGILWEQLQVPPTWAPLWGRPSGSRITPTGSTSGASSPSAEATSRSPGGFGRRRLNEEQTQDVKWRRHGEFISLQPRGAEISMTS